MENASKALIIAGAILIAILLISVGIMVMNSMNKPLDVAASEADSQAVQMYNSKFAVYEGRNKDPYTARQALLLAKQEGLAIRRGKLPDPSILLFIEDVDEIVSGKTYCIQYTVGSDGRFTEIGVWVDTYTQ